MHLLVYFNIFPYIFLTEALIGEKIRRADDYEFSFTVSIGTKNPNKAEEQNHFCTGVLISYKTVLTCAHCFEGETRDRVQVIIGSGNLATGKKHDVASWTTFDTWAAPRNRSLPDYHNDIAVLLLSKPIYNAKIKPVKLSPLNAQQIWGKEAIMAGFGITNNGTRSGYLMAGNVTVLSHDQCEERMHKYSNKPFKLIVTEFCSATDPYVLGGGGDSGGPILNMDNELLGINLGLCPKNKSWYKPLCPQDEESLKKYKTNLHSGLDFYRDFINDFRDKI